MAGRGAVRKLLIVTAIAGGLSMTAKAAAPARAPGSTGASGPTEHVYGRELPIVKDLGIGPTMAARVVGERLYTIGRGKLHVFDLSDPSAPTVLGKLGGLGNTRQIAVRGGVAYITAREDGVFIVDVRDASRPKLLCHYDPIEVATGVDVSGDVLFVACRSHGVQLVDVSEPCKPLHLGVARTGEAQSIAVRNGYAYVGVWGTSELVVVDARNPREPRIAARCPLDGYGDGVAVRGDTVYVATGHHSRARRKRPPREGDPGYGCGHGLEIYDVSDPAVPKFASRVKTPSFYQIGNDMWSVKLAGRFAFLADTYNGVFVVDVSEREKPFFVAHKRLPQRVTRKQLSGKEPVLAQTAKQLPAYVGGLALGPGVVYVAGGATDLHVLGAPGLAAPCLSEPDAPPVIPPFGPRRHDRFRIYRPDGQVRDAAFMDDTAVVAAGGDGVHVVELGPELRRLSRCDTKGFAMAVRSLGDLVYVAEEKGGLSIWRRTGCGSLALEGRYQPRGRIVRDVVVPGAGRYAVLQLDLAMLDIVDVSDPTAPKRVFRDKGHGFVYHIGEDLIDGRQICVLWQIGGLRWYDLYGVPAPGFSGEKYAHRLGAGGTVGVGGRRLAAYWRGLLLVGKNEVKPPGDLPIRRIANRRVSGAPRLYGSKLYVAERTTGDVCVLDVSDPVNPRLLEHFNVPGNPGRITLHKGALAIPNGYEGLWLEKKPE